MKRVAILGSTGSVGTQALDIVSRYPDRFAAVALTAHRREAELLEQTSRFAPDGICLTEGNERPTSLDRAIGWHTGAHGILAVLEASKPDLVLNAITGAAGLAASEWSLKNGIPLALANKESLVVAGEYLMALAAEQDVPILPVDSEHCAIFQCLNGEQLAEVRKIYLTGSGGPFRQRDTATFATVTPDEALRHPTWDMGPRITVGSATMMNKAFEILEARWLFGLEPDQIQAVIHPQSIVHSMVEFVDGSMLAQLGLPDMRIPILYCMSWPNRIPFPFEPFDLKRFASLEFQDVEPQRFPAVPLAYEVLERSGDSGAVLNAADEVLTAEFLAGNLPFPSIVAGAAEVLRSRPPQSVTNLDTVRTADQQAREAAGAFARGLRQP